MHDYIDIGVNLTGSAFSKDVDAVIQRAVDAGVARMIVTGTDVEHSEAAIELCERYPRQLYATAGVHPHHADEFSDRSLQQLEALAQHAAVVAVGECGLDFNRKYSTIEAQRRAFRAQLELAVKLRKPVFLHQRDAHEEYLALLREYREGLVDAVAHCFTGNASQAADLLALDMHIGITGWICDERRGGDLQQAVKHIPLERILLETDAPYLLPRDLEQKPLVSRRNEPCYLPHVAARVAEYKGVSVEQLRDSVYRNTQRIFRL